MVGAPATYLLRDIELVGWKRRGVQTSRRRCVAEESARALADRRVYGISTCCSTISSMVGPHAAVAIIRLECIFVAFKANLHAGQWSGVPSSWRYKHEPCSIQAVSRQRQTPLPSFARMERRLPHWPVGFAYRSGKTPSTSTDRAWLGYIYIVIQGPRPRC